MVISAHPAWITSTNLKIMIISLWNVSTIRRKLSTIINFCHLDFFLTYHDENNSPVIFFNSLFIHERIINTPVVLNWRRKIIDKIMNAFSRCPLRITLYRPHNSSAKGEAVRNAQLQEELVRSKLEKEISKPNLRYKVVPMLFLYIKKQTNRQTFCTNRIVCTHASCIHLFIALEY